MSNRGISKHCPSIRLWALVLALTTFILLTADLSAQDKSTYYSVTHPKKYKINWKAFYDKIDEMTAKVREELPHNLDLPYGDDPKQKLDIYLPKEKPEGAPVFVYIHGGGFFEGDRAHYGYVARPFAKHGILTVVPSYRLTPQGFHYPAQPEDIEQALTWIYRNIKSYGGNPERIYIAGHSAGAILVAFVSMKTEWLGKMSLPADLIKGCVPISGGYDLRQWSLKQLTYVSKPDQRAEASPLLNIQSPPPKTIVAVGSREKQSVKASQNFVRKIREKGGAADLVVVDGMEHDEIAVSLGDEEGKLFRAILSMIGSR